MGAKVISLGHTIPKQKITNQFFIDEGLETSDEWIKERTGIESRYFTPTGTASSDLGYEAAIDCLNNAKLTSKEIDLILVATSTPDYNSFPSTACLIQDKLKCNTIPAFDISAACSGFCYALSTAEGFLATQKYQHILVIGVDCLSKITNMKDRSTCILFGDGAGAALLTQSDTNNNGIIYSNIKAQGNLANILKVPKGGSKYPFDETIAKEKSHFIEMDGTAVFKQAISIVVTEIKESLSKVKLTTNEIDYLICHQANQRILNKICNNLNIPTEKCISNINQFGNTSAASIPLAMSEFHNKNGFKKDDIIILAGFGAGFTWGITIIKWS
tara:strand:- start:9520 stop:10509 length:990 start_codon:yes stop_codon:yes gene_type:complete